MDTITLNGIVYRAVTPEVEEPKKRKCSGLFHNGITLKKGFTKATYVFKTDHIKWLHKNCSERSRSLLVQKIFDTYIENHKE